MRNKFIYFQLAGARPTGKTDKWEVRVKGDGCVLGEIRWFARWRCYAFYPYSQTVFERQCLRDLAEFCEQETIKQRSRIQLDKGND